MKLKTTVKLRAKGDCPTHSLAEISIRDQSVSIDEPLENGGSNKGPTPTGSALAALIGCTNIIGHKCARSLGVELGHLSIEAVADFDRRGVTLAEEVDVPFLTIDLKISADGPASETDLQRVAAEVQKFCPLSKLFRQAGTIINETWQKA